MTWTSLMRMMRCVFFLGFWFYVFVPFGCRVCFCVYFAYQVVFHRHALSKVPGLINIAAEQQSHKISKKQKKNLAFEIGCFIYFATLSSHFTIDKETCCNGKNQIKWCTYTDADNHLVRVLHVGNISHHTCYQTTS